MLVGGVRMSCRQVIKQCFDISLGENRVLSLV